MKKLLIAVLALGMMFGAVSTVFAVEVPAVVTETVQTELKDVLQGTLVDIINGVVSAKDFLLEQIPDVLQQLLMWKMLESLAMTIFGIMLCVSTFVFWYLVMKCWDNIARANCEPLLIVFGIIGSCFSIGGSFVLPNLTWLQIWVAPKVYLIEYAAELIK